MNAIGGYNVAEREVAWTAEDIAAAERLEAFETEQWAADALFRVEIFTRRILDPCCGRRVLGDAARRAGYANPFVIETDIYPWGLNRPQMDFLDPEYPICHLEPYSVVMNPPFSKACEFVEQALGFGARKVACFQRWAWWGESRTRRQFWDKYPPARIWACGDRATCFPITMSDRERKFAANGKRRGESKTAHAWFIFEPAHTGGTQIGKIWNPAKDKRWA